MYICCDCKNSFKTAEFVSELQPYGEGFVNEPEYPICPFCGSNNIEEAKCCEICGEYTSSDDLYNDMCIYCIEDEMSDIDTILEYADTITKDGEINNFIDYAFANNSGNINEALKNLIQIIYEYDPAKIKHIMSKYIEKNADDISEWLIEEKWKD